jgi:hypothetical protein
VASGRGSGFRPRRVSLPGVAELLRQASATPASTGVAGSPAGVIPGSSAPVGPVPVPEPRRPASGRERHTEKITVYLSARELLDLERARLALRSAGLPADRGRIVREALAVLLADLEAHGAGSVLARRLRDDG